MSGSFEKCRTQKNMYRVGNGSNIVGVHKDEVRQLKEKLEEAVDPDTGHWESEYRHGTSRMKVDEDGVVLESKYADGNWGKIRLGYRDAKEVIEGIEKRMLEEAEVEKRLDEIS